MAPTKTLGALLALFVVATGAAAAMPGNAPVDVPDQADNQTVDAEEQARAEMNETAEDERGEAEESRAGGPPADVPGAAPDFVSETHATINDYLSGAVKDLGSAISEVTPGGDADERTNQDQTETSGNAGEETDQPVGTPA